MDGTEGKKHLHFNVEIYTGYKKPPPVAKQDRVQINNDEKHISGYEYEFLPRRGPATGIILKDKTRNGLYQ